MKERRLCGPWLHAQITATVKCVPNGTQCPNSSVFIPCLSVAALLFLTGCHRDMRDQPRYETFEASEFFGDGQSSRPLVEGTIARGQLYEDDALYRGKQGDDFVAD